jgi:hypothetical protein
MIIMRDEIAADGYVLRLTLHRTSDGFGIEGSLTAEGIVREYCMADGVAEEQDEAVRMFELLRDNAVFPCHIACVLGDVFRK